MEENVIIALALAQNDYRYIMPCFSSLLYLYDINQRGKAKHVVQPQFQKSWDAV